MDKMDARLGSDIFKQIIVAGGNRRCYGERRHRWSGYGSGTGDMLFDRNGGQRQNQTNHDDRNEPTGITFGVVHKNVSCAGQAVLPGFANKIFRWAGFNKNGQFFVISAALSFVG